MKYNYSQEDFEKFWWWINERQNIFEKRFINQESRPWTNDKFLRERHFCNVYRELDRQSQYYIRNIANEGDPRDVFLNTLLFRIFNKGETWDIIGFQEVDSFDSESIIEDISFQRDNGNLKPFNSAYMITGSIYPELGSDKVRKYIQGMGEQDIIANIDRYWDNRFTWEGDKLVCDKSPSEMTNIWEEISGISDFLAYELYCDLTYNDWFPWDENDYVNLGPGANRGINWIFGALSETEIREDESKGDYLNRNINKSVPVDPVEFMEYLRDVQSENLPDNFYYWEDNDLTLRAIEHSLCEYDKWRRAWWKDENDVQQRMSIFNKRDDPLFENNETQKQDGFSEFA